MNFYYIDKMTGFLYSSNNTATKNKLRVIVDATIILTAAGSVISVIACNIGLFSWLKSDIDLNRAEASADRRDLLQIMREIREEMKDFHGRLCSIEERNKR